MAPYTPLPQTKARRLVDRLSQASEVGTANDVVLRRLEQEAQQLMHADVVGAHTVLGGVASLRWDLDRVRHHFRIALQHLDAARTHNNYAVALSNVEELQVAYEEVSTAHDRAPDDKSFLEHAIKLSAHAGRFADGRRLCERWNALAPDTPHPLTPWMTRLANAVESNVFTEGSVQRLLGIMSELPPCERAESRQRNDHVRTAATATWEDAKEPGSFLHEVLVDATTPDAARLNAMFVDRVISQADLMEDPGYHFVPVFIGARV
ncbi:MAG: hypothetical protein OXH09_09780 [Gammaproteobacteria bacterium]|nr:hypothetical protein [Gammaproteobacteria bacterium]